MLATKPWVFGSPTCSYFRTIENICREHGVQLHQRFRTNEDLTVLPLVADGLAMTLTARAQVEASGLQDKIIILPHFRASVPLNIGYQTARAGEPAIAARVLRRLKSDEEMLVMIRDFCSRIQLGFDISVAASPRRRTGAHAA